MLLNLIVLPTDEVVRYKNRPDLQFIRQMSYLRNPNRVNKNDKRKQFQATT
jgi:hypothetical protein